MGHRRGKVVLLRGNALIHATNIVEETRKQLNWDVMHHYPYSQNIALLDYHLFRSMAHGLDEEQFPNFEEMKKWLIDPWLISKNESFHHHRIYLLLER